MKIYDTHAHLDHIENIEQAMDSADKAGVEGIVAVSMDVESCKKNLAIAVRFKRPTVFLAMGMHPSEADVSKLDECEDLIYEHKEKLIAIGEVGLDFWYKDVRKNEEKKEEQRVCFRRFLTIAKDLKLPVIVHSRGAWRDALDMVKSYEVEKAVFHWYDGPVDVMKEMIAEGYFVSTTPNLAYNANSRSAIMEADIQHLLIETDSPVYFNNRKAGIAFQAEPKDVLKTLKAYSQLKNLNEDEACDIFNNNAKKFFDLN